MQRVPLPPTRAYEPVNNAAAFASLGVTKQSDAHIVVSAEQPENAEFIELTDDVFHVVRSSVMRLVQPSNQLSVESGLTVVTKVTILIDLRLAY